MAELKCKDGTVIKISDETEAELRKAFTPKREIKHGDVFINTNSILDVLQRKRIVIFDGTHWIIYGGWGCGNRQIIMVSKSRLDNYINTRNGKTSGDNYVFQYNIFEEN